MRGVLCRLHISFAVEALRRRRAGRRATKIRRDAGALARDLASIQSRLPEIFACNCWQDSHGRANVELKEILVELADVVEQVMGERLELEAERTAFQKETEQRNQQWERERADREERFLKEAQWRRGQREEERRKEEERAELEAQLAQDRARLEEALGDKRVLERELRLRRRVEKELLGTLKEVHRFRVGFHLQPTIISFNSFYVHSSGARRAAHGERSSAGLGEGAVLCGERAKRGRGVARGESPAAIAS